MKMNFLYATLLVMLATLCYADDPGHCVMYGECEEDVQTGLMRPCTYNGTAIPLTDQIAKDFLNSVCPDLKPDKDYKVCCNADQVSSFQDSFYAMGALFKRCPSCYHNLAIVFCELTCSPTQSLFMEVTNTTKNDEGVETVLEMNYYIDETFTRGLFKSCQNVQLSFTTEKAIGITCGAHFKDCTPHRWLRYMGGHDPSPYQINFQFTNETLNERSSFIPMNKTIIPCSEPVGKDGEACSCVDCPCHPDPPPEFPSHMNGA